MTRLKISTRRRSRFARMSALGTSIRSVTLPAPAGAPARAGADSARVGVRSLNSPVAGATPAPAARPAAVARRRLLRRPSSLGRDLRAARRAAPSGVFSSSDESVIGSTTPPSRPGDLMEHPRRVRVRHD